MKLELEQREDMLANDEKLKTDWVDKLWKEFTRRRNSIKKEIFDLLYSSRHFNFSHHDKYLHYAVSEDKVKPWNKLYYDSTSTYLLIFHKIPELLKQRNITRYTADKISKILQWMVYCDDILSKREIQSNPLATKTTEELLNWKRLTWVQLEIPFDFDEEEKPWDKVQEDQTKRNFLSDEQMNDLYKNDDENENWWNRI